MTNDEWDSIALILENAWRGEFDEDRADVYRTFLDPYSPEAVMSALHILVQNGKPFLPAASEIVAAIRDAMTAPTPPWAEVWPQIRRVMSKYTRTRPRSSGKAVATAWARDELHPVVVGFIESEDLERLVMVAFDDPEWGPLRLRELEQRWDEYAGVALQRLERGLALSAVRREQIGPSKFDPAAVLGLEPPQKALGDGN